MKQTFPEKLQILAGNKKTVDECVVVANTLGQQIENNPPQNLGGSIVNLIRALTGIGLVAGSVYFGGENVGRLVNGQELRT